MAIAASGGALMACAGDPADDAARPITTAVSTSTTAPTMIEPVDGLRAAVERSRLLSAQRMLELIIRNDSSSVRQLSAYRLESPMFEVVAPHERDVMLRTGGGRISVPMPYGEPLCTPGEPVAPSTVTLLVDGHELRLTVDDLPLRQQHDAECAQERVEAAVSLRFGDSWVSGAPGTLVGEVVIAQRVAGTTAVVDEIAGTVVLTLSFEEGVDATLRVDDDHPRGRARAVVSVSGCSAHALIESKKTYRFPAWVSVDGEPPLRIELEPKGEARRSMEELLAACPR